MLFLPLAAVRKQPVTGRAWGGYHISVVIELHQRCQRFGNTMTWIQVMAGFAYPAEICVIQSHFGIADILSSQRDRPMVRYLSGHILAILAYAAVNTLPVADETRTALKPRGGRVERPCPVLRHNITSIVSSLDTGLSPATLSEPRYHLRRAVGKRKRTTTMTTHRR